MVFLRQATPNVNTNPLPTHEGRNVNMIETDDDSCGMKVITLIVHGELEKVVDSLSIKEKKEFTILTPAKVVVLVPSKTLIRPNL